MTSKLSLSLHEWRAAENSEDLQLIPSLPSNRWLSVAHSNSPGLVGLVEEDDLEELDRLALVVVHSDLVPSFAAASFAFASAVLASALDHVVVEFDPFAEEEVLAASLVVHLVVGLVVAAAAALD